MEPIVKEFLESRRSAERQKFEKERDELLVSLGLVENVKEYSPDGTKTPGYVEFDEEANNYYRVKTVPVVVTDEEFEEIKKYMKPNVKASPSSHQSSSRKTREVVIDNGPEKFLSALNVVWFIFCCIWAMIVFFLAVYYGGKHDVLWGLAYAICIIFGGVVLYCLFKVILNISNNLHKINAKIK